MVSDSYSVKRAIPLTKFQRFGGIPSINKLGYFVLDSIVDKSKELYVSIGLAHTILLIPIKTIKNGIIQNRSHQIRHWVSYCDGFNIWIRYDSIPVNTKNRRKIPLLPDEMYRILQADTTLKEEYFRNQEYSILRADLEQAYSNGFPHFISSYTKDFEDPRERILYSKTHSIFERVLIHWQRKIPPEAIFSAFRDVMYAELTQGNEIVFDTENQRSFWRKIKLAKDIGIKRAIVHASKGVSRGGARQIPDKVTAYIRMLLRRPERLPYPKILSKVRTKFSGNISLSYIKKIAADPETKNLVKHDANGFLYSRANSLPKLSRDLFTSPGECFQGDFYKLQFLYRNHIGVVGRMVGYFILDVFSRKVVGWSLGEEQSEEVALSAFKMAFTSCGFLPNEIWLDNDLYYNTAKFKRFVLSTQSIGVTWKFGEPHMPTERAEIESFFSKFQKQLCSDKKFFIGEGIQSRNRRGRPSAELIKKYWSMKKELPTVQELNAQFTKMIQQYNFGTYHDEAATSL